MSAVHYTGGVRVHSEGRSSKCCMMCLCSAGAHPSLTDGCGWLPLHYAVDRGHIECVKAILAYPNFLGLTGLKSALGISHENQFDEITTVLETAKERCVGGCGQPGGRGLGCTTK